ncbi:hypothetical protein [Propionivibrio sp.]|nr:hypothetical protein [Propionivibrio sp.]MBK8745700.1 hypothetical protein [Propionivibrio sp.]
MAIATLTIDLVAKLASLERDMGKAAQIAEKTPGAWTRPSRRSARR